MVIVTTSYNNMKWIEKNINSILFQQYRNYRVIYINDASQDGTGNEVERLIKKARLDYQVIDFDDYQSDDIEKTTRCFAEAVNHESHFFTLVNNVNRCGGLCNHYRAIHSCLDNEVIVSLDADDWFSNKNVLRRLNAVYQAPDVWFTHGSLIEHPSGSTNWCEPIPSEIIERNEYRKFKCPSHLKTFYAWIFKKIELQDLLWNGKFFPMTWDMAMMYPICEMAGERHAFIKEINYVYNMENSLNDNKVDPYLQNELDRFIRNKPAYSRLEIAD